MYMILLSPVFLFSQKTFVSLGAELAFPGSSESLSRNAGTGYGASVRIESSWGKHISGMATLGYLGFAEAQPYSYTSVTKSKVYAIIFQPGIKYYIQKKRDRPRGFFISAEIGLMYTNTHFDYEANPDFNFDETGLSCAPGIGYQLGKIETGFRLQYNLTASGYNVYYYNIRVAYAFLKRNSKNY